MEFTVHEHDGEWVLRLHDGGSYVGLGVLVGEDEANRVCGALNASLQLIGERDRWWNYLGK